MALTTLDRNTALIIIDLQKGIVAYPTAHPIDEVVKRARSLPVRFAGVATATGVESTARQAYEQGFNVTLATDAMTDMRPEAHDYSITQVSLVSVKRAQRKKSSTFWRRALKRGVGT